MIKRGDSPLISVISVVYNCCSTLESTIKSIMIQKYTSFEFIIIDGASTDGTQEIIKKYQDRISFWLSESDNGIYDAMNKGIKNAKGKYLFFLGGDDQFFDDSVLKNAATYLVNPANIYYGNAHFIKKNVLYDGKFNSIKIVTRNICHQSIFYPREIFTHFFYNERYRVYADYDLNLRLFNNKFFRFKYIPLTIARFCDEGISGVRTLDANFEKDRMKIIKENFPLWVYYYRVIRTFFASLLFNK